MRVAGCYFGVSLAMQMVAWIREFLVYGLVQNTSVSCPGRRSECASVCLVKHGTRHGTWWLKLGLDDIMIQYYFRLLLWIFFSEALSIK